MNETILVVDDDPLLRDVYRAVIAKAGYNVLVAINGADGQSLFAANKNTINLVLTDVNMPEVIGPDMVANLRLLKPGLKAIFMSGYAENGQVGSKLLEEGSILIQKPFSTAKLLETIRQVLAS